MKLLLILVSFIASIITYAGDITVSMSVSGDEQLTELVSSYINREFRDLHDVTIVSDTRADYEVRVIALANTLKTGQQIGYILSVVVLATVPTNTFDAAVSKEIRPFLHNYLATLSQFDNNYLYSSGPAELKTTCENIVARIDSAIFEPERQNERQIEILLKNISTNAPDVHPVSTNTP
jgi:hypothetical protein